MKTLKQRELEHWNRIACGSDISIESEFPYCDKYVIASANNNNICHGCPIAISTGSLDCQNTPYWKIQHAFYNSDKLWQANVADEIEAMIELIESLPEEE